MSGATQRENFYGLTCTGHHPFRPNRKNDKCNLKMIPSQRGASNVYFAVSRSAISIPPWVNPLYNLIDEHLNMIENYEEDFGEAGLQKAYEKFFSAYTRQHEIQNNKVRMVLFQQIQGFGAGVGSQHLILLLPHGFFHQIPDMNIILNDRNCFHGITSQVSLGSLRLPIPSTPHTQRDKNTTLAMTKQA
jgi:hypothetical protein